MKKQWEPYYSPLFAQALRDLADFDTKHPSKSDMPLVRSRRENRKGRGGRGRGRGRRREGWGSKREGIWKGEKWGGRSGCTEGRREGRGREGGRE